MMLLALSAQALADHCPTPSSLTQNTEGYWVAPGNWHSNYKAIGDSVTGFLCAEVTRIKVKPSTYYTATCTYQDNLGDQINLNPVSPAQGYTIDTSTGVWSDNTSISKICTNSLTACSFTIIN
jgi:hypothetical protein